MPIFRFQSDKDEHSGRPVRDRVQTGFVKGKIPDDEEDEKEQEESVRQTPKLKSEILAGLVDHMKGLRKEDLAKIYGKTVLEQDDEEDEDEDPVDDDEEDDDEVEEKKVKKESIDQIIVSYHQ